MTAQHTPGPWRADRYGQFRYTVRGETGGARESEAVAVVDSLACSRDGQAFGWCTANARLIAAAPDLLAALDAMIGLTSCPVYKREDWQRIQDQARAAVAKAGGYQWPPK